MLTNVDIRKIWWRYGWRRRIVIRYATLSREGLFQYRKYSWMEGFLGGTKLSVLRHTQEHNKMCTINARFWVHNLHENLNEWTQPICSGKILLWLWNFFDSYRCWIHRCPYFRLNWSHFRLHCNWSTDFRLRWSDFRLIDFSTLVGKKAKWLDHARFSTNPMLRLLSLHLLNASWLLLDSSWLWLNSSWLLLNPSCALWSICRRWKWFFFRSA